MRIPSQFNEDSLYRRARGRPESSKSYRRLARLLIALALVVVFMRQASKPSVYQTFFPSSTATPAAAVQSLAASGAESGPHRPENMIGVPVAPEDRRVANLLTQDLLPADQREWVVALSRWQSGRPVDTVPSTAQSIRDRLQSLESISEEQRLEWRGMIESLLNQKIERDAEGSSAVTSIDRPRVAAFVAALDDAAASRVVDGSVWRSGDFDSFYRYLDQAGDLPATGIAATGVLPLLQQPLVFRNQLVRVDGGVARAERIDAKENLYGITEYWQLWLRPSDGADRPLVAIVPAVPDLVASVGRDASVQQGPQVTIVGRFLKRLAYESSLGVDLAPVVVGRIAFAPMTENEVVDRIDVDDSFQSRLWLTVAVASLCGFALAAIAILRTSTMARRSRELRAAHRPAPDQFLKGLGDVADHDESGQEADR